jgi:hypothetical protein
MQKLQLIKSKGGLKSKKGGLNSKKADYTVKKADYKVKKGAYYKVKRRTIKKKADYKVLLYSPPLLIKADLKAKKLRQRMYFPHFCCFPFHF